MNKSDKELLEEFNDLHEAFTFMMFKNNDLPLLVDELLYKHIGKDREYNLFIMVLKHGTIAGVNEEWCNTFGFEYKDVFKKKIFDFIHPEDIDSTAKEFEKVKKSGLPKPFRNRYRCKDGNYLLLEWTVDVPTESTAVCGFAKVVY